MKYIVAVLFLGLTGYNLAQARGLDLSPPGLANETAATISCIGSPLMVFALLSIPVVFTVFYFASYLNIEKKSRSEGKGSFYSDELLVLVISSFVVATIINIVYTFWEVHGIPVKYLFSKYYFCDETGSFQNKCGLFMPESMVLPETCKQVYVARQPGFASAFNMLMVIGTFFYKLILVLVPVISIVVLASKNATSGLRDIREKRYNARLVLLIVFIDFVVISLTVSFYYSIIYSILGIPWSSLVQWFVNAGNIAITAIFGAGARTL